MSFYLDGVDVLGAEESGPLSTKRARTIVYDCLGHVSDPELARQLNNVGESIERCGLDTLPDNATQVLYGLVTRAYAPREASAYEILGDVEIGSHDPRPYWARGFSPYLETSPIYDNPPDDEWLVPRAGGGYQRVILGEDEVGHHGHGMVPGGWWWAGSYRGPWVEADDFVDPMEMVDPAILQGEDILGEDAYDVLGMFDIASAQRKMNALPKKVTVRMAKALLAGGQEAITGAQAIAAQKSLPGGTARDNVAAHLSWHNDKLARMTGSPNAFYDPGQDLAKYVMMAFIEANAAEEGATYLDQAWSQMWQEIANAIAALPSDIRKAVVSAASGAIETITGLPVWAWALIAVGSVGLLGFLAYKIIGAAANSKAGAATAGVLARRYL